MNRYEEKLKNGQIIRDLGGEHVVKSFGRCIVCHRIVFGYEGDPCPDWRGAIGDATHDEFRAEEYDTIGPDVPCCAMCMNTAASYKIGLERAKKLWK